MLKNYKLFNATILISTVLLALPSCATTKAESTSKESEDAKIEAVSVSNFKKEVENMNITLVSAPDAPMAGSPFAKPFVVSVKDNDGNPYSNYTLSVKVPTGKNNGVIEYETIEAVTDENGRVSYKPSTFPTSMNAVITFSPKIPFNSSTNQKLAKAVSLEVPCRVRFALVKKSILVNLVDYDQKGKMIVDSGITSSNLVGEFWRAGYPYQAQNADFHKQIDAGSAAVYARAKEMVQGSTYYKYIVYGKVKYASDIKEVEGGYSLSLTGTVTVIDWTTGKDIYTVTKTSTVVDKNKWAVYKACQTQLAKDLCNDLVYSM